MTEGQLFTGIVKWCRANTETEREAIAEFQQDFAAKILDENISQSEFINDFLPLREFIPIKRFRRLSFELTQNPFREATRFALIPCKEILTVIDKEDFLDPIPGTLFIDNDADPNYVFWQTTDEFEDVNVEVRIYQKISQGRLQEVPQGRMGIILETVHILKDGADMSCITERVSVKMIARSVENGSVIEKRFKPIEDTFIESPGQSRTNIFVLSKNQDERVKWSVMEVGVIIDRRPQCDIKAISAEKFATTVCSSASADYPDAATALSYDVEKSLDHCLIDMAERLNFGNRGPERLRLNYSIYIFTKGYVSNLRSKKSVRNEIWEAQTMEDFQRCKVMNFPIGMDNVDMESRRKAFNTLIVDREVRKENAEQKELFVVRYNPSSKNITFVKRLQIQATHMSGMVTLGHTEGIQLGCVMVTEDLKYKVLIDSGLGPMAMGKAKVFIRRIFPIQDEMLLIQEGILVSKVTVGKIITHIDDYHVLVIQDPGEGMDYDEFIISKIREIKVQFEEVEVLDDEDGISVELSLAPQTSPREVARTLATQLGLQESEVELFKYTSSSTMQHVDVENESENVESLLNYCKKGTKIIFYRMKGHSSDESNNSDFMEER